MSYPIGPSIIAQWHQTALRLENKTALICGDAQVSHKKLKQQVDLVEAALIKAGVKRTDRVVLLLENSIEFAVAMLAVQQLNAVMVAISSWTKTNKLSFILEDTKATALITQSSLNTVCIESIASAKTNNSVLLLVADTLLKDRSSTSTQPNINNSLADDQATSNDENCHDDDLAAIIYTSGSTGKPKGVMLSHANMRAAWNSVHAYLQLREDDIIGLALPVPFSYGLYYLIMGLGIGATVVIEQNVSFPVVLLQSWERHRVTVFPGVPTLFASVLKHDLTQFDLSSLRIVTNAGAALPNSVLDQLSNQLPQTQLFAMYGLTECKRASYLAPEDLHTKAGSVGRGLLGQRHWLIDEAGFEVETGATGQLVVAGPHVMQGYWNRPDETAKALQPAPDGTPALHTGDLFSADADGYLYFVSRSDDIIKTRGEKVSPLEVEQAICGLIGVANALVFGVPDELLGQAIRADVKLDGKVELTDRDVIRHCLSRLDSTCVPKFVVFVEDLSVTDSGKVIRRSI